jgi:hypothetical protein
MFDKVFYPKRHPPRLFHHANQLQAYSFRRLAYTAPDKRALANARLARFSEPHYWTGKLFQHPHL